MPPGLVGSVDVLVRRFREKRREAGLLAATSMLARLGVSVLSFPAHRVLRRHRTFELGGRRHPYFAHWYNTTYDNERAVEVSLALAALADAPGARVLEVGNVLSHYVDASHDVLDLFEKGQHVIHQDVAVFRPTQPYDLIISISTLEHVGCDDEPRPGKILEAMQNLRACLRPGGRLLVTMPVGYNTFADQCVREGRLFQQQRFMVRTSRDNIWTECPASTALAARFNTPFPFGNGLVIGLG